MNVNREKLLAVLESVTSGLAKKEIVEQSNFFVFSGGRVFTYNDEVFCSVASPLEIDGAIPSEPLIGLLKKLSASEINVEISDGVLKIKSGRGRATIKIESEIKLPVGSLETPEKWSALPEGFMDAMSVVIPCAGSDSSKFILTCVNVAPEWLESSDNYQVCRYRLKTGIKVPTIIKHTSLQSILGMGMDEFGETENWFHFRRKKKLVIACRRYMDKFPSDTIESILSTPAGSRVKIPKNIGAALDKCQVFITKDLGGSFVDVRFKDGAMKVNGVGAYGDYSEICDVKYSGDPIQFRIDPNLLAEISRRDGKCSVSPKLVKVESEKFIYVTATQKAE